MILLTVIMSNSGAQTVNISGTVRDRSGSPITDATVELKRMQMSAVTDATGKFSLVSTSVATPGEKPLESIAISLTHGVITLNLSKPSPVKIELFDMKGNRLEVINHRVQQGTCRFDLQARPQAVNMTVIRISTTMYTKTLRYLFLDAENRMSGGVPSGNPDAALLFKVKAVVDTMKITADNFLTLDSVITSYEGVMNITLDSINLDKFSFFVTSLKSILELSGTKDGFGGDLRFGKTGPGAGLLGADSICQCIAEKSMPGSKAKKWRAFLSAVSGPDGKQVNAIDRIGTGPWYDRRGRIVSNNIQELMEDRPAGADLAIINDLPNEYGIPNHRPDPNRPVEDNHHMLTGSSTDGTLYSANATCDDWTSRTTLDKPRCGLSWPRSGFTFPGMSGENWISAFDAGGCNAGIDLDEKTLMGTGTYVGSGGGYGGFYCFALHP
jgi:hypothetical protein